MTTGPKQPNADKRRILVVEDSKFQRAIMVKLLSEHGFSPVEVTNTHQATQRMHQEKPDAAVVCWELNGLSGLQLIHNWQADDTLKWIPVVMLTSHIEASYIQKALDAGALDFVAKPPNIVELKARLHTAIRIKDLQTQLRIASECDPLTGLYNRRMLNQTCARWTREQRPFCLALLDIDFFKKVNDQYGHDIGDIVLVQMAKLIKERVSTTIRGFRIGGEEFVMLFRSPVIEEATAFMNDMLAEVQSRSWGANTNPFSLSFSCGISAFGKQEHMGLATKQGDQLDASADTRGEARGDAGDNGTAHDPTDSLDALLKRADEALYAAKRQGRARVLVFEPSPEVAA